MRASSRAVAGAAILLAIAFCTCQDAHAHHRSAPDSETLTPADTVIVANRVDARFIRDYSVLLKSLRLEWIIADSSTVPDSARDMNVILLGRLQSVHTGEIMRSMLSAEELDIIRTAGNEHILLVKDSPWAEDKSVYVCTGDGLLKTRDAAEEAARAIMARSPPASAWIASRFDAPQEESMRETTDRLRYTLQDAELPLVDLNMEVGAEPRRRISAQQAAQDVERLFYLFSHGYGGYAFFDQEGAFAQAKTRILEEIETKRTWSTKDLAQMFYEHLGFITDCHLKIGGYQYAGHVDFWYDSSLELAPGEDGYELESEGRRYELVSVNGQDPEKFVFPSLSAQGVPVYRLGTLSQAEPAPLRLLAARDGEKRLVEIALQRSDFDYFSDQVFREDNLGGIPVLRVRGFGDTGQAELRRFVETARAHKDEPVLIVDIRGNGGGNEKWPVQWILGLTGQRAGPVFSSSELHSKTTMAGRANLFAHYYDLYPDMDAFLQDAARFTNAAQAIEDGTRAAGWTPLHHPQMSLIPNDTTLIIVMNGLVASAGEGFVMRASQLENVVLVGENSRGALTFGNISTHQLPNSRLTVIMPINFGLFPDRKSREGLGIEPDLWVPAADAVNYAVAAVRAGTITTQRSLSPTTLGQPFVPENSLARVWLETASRLLVIAGIAAAGSAWAFFVRKRPRAVAGLGFAWTVLGAAWTLSGRHFGLGFLLAGGVCLAWGGLTLLRARRVPVESSI